MSLRKIGSAPFSPRTPSFGLHTPPLPHAPLFFISYTSMFIISFLRAPPFMTTLHPCLVFCLLGFCCIFTSSRTSTITNPAPLHTLCIPILNLFYILLAAPPPLINTPHLLHIPPTNHSHTPIFCFPLSSFLIKLFLFMYLFIYLFCFYYYFFIFIHLFIYFYYLFIIYLLFYYFIVFFVFFIFIIPRKPNI